jgi:serine phosphatase RsbU (regulator of sigma subunit)
LGLGESYESRTLHLSPEQTLVAFTDGILERRSEAITLSLQRLAASCESAPRQPDALCEHLMRDMLVDAPNDDDAAVVAVRLAR